MRVLVVDDEAGVRDTVSHALRLAGYDVSTAGDGLTALDLVRAEHPDALVLDVMMPRMDGLETCRVLRAEGHRFPVLMITAHDSDRDRTAGLTAGADDYLVKPFALQELVTRLRSLVRRPAAATGGPVLHPAERQLAYGGGQVSLSTTEYRIAEALLQHGPLRSAELYEHVWGYDFGGGAALLEPYLTALRRRIAAIGCRVASGDDGYRITVGQGGPA
jgi:two-component system, OmpR family, response regulator MprA